MKYTMHFFVLFHDFSHFALPFSHSFLGIELTMFSFLLLQVEEIRESCSIFFPLHSSFFFFFKLMVRSGDYSLQVSCCCLSTKLLFNNVQKMMVWTFVCINYTHVERDFIFSEGHLHGSGVERDPPLHISNYFFGKFGPAPT